MRFFFLSAVIALLLNSSLFAAYERGELIWECNFTEREINIFGRHQLRDGIEWSPNEGIKGDGALFCKATTFAGTPNYIIRLFPKTFSGLILLEAVVKGVDIQRGKLDYHAPKVMLHIRWDDPQKGPNRTKWCPVSWEFGSYDWKTFIRIEEIPANAKQLDLYLRLQDVPGKFWIDRVRIFRAREIPDSEVKAPFNVEASRLPRGAFEKKNNPNAARGFMSGNDLSPAAFDTLRKWNANLLRLQLSIPKEARNDEKRFLSVLHKELDRAEKVLELCRKNGIRMVLDLHAAPGTKVSNYVSNMIPDDYDTTTLKKAWDMIVTRFGNDPYIYGYDIVNEPSAPPQVWDRIFREVVTEIRKKDKKTPVITESLQFHYPDENVIYSPHFYSPHDLTHFGIGSIGRIRWSYPSYINGVFWNKEQLRVALRRVIEFQKEHNARIYIGEFSCVPWVSGCEQYINDCIELFNEYGWDWTYHAFREAQIWNIEYESIGNSRKLQKAKQETPRKKVILKGLKNNRPFSL